MPELNGHAVHLFLHETEDKCDLGTKCEEYKTKAQHRKASCFVQSIQGQRFSFKVENPFSIMQNSSTLYKVYKRSHDIKEQVEEI